MKKRMLLLVLSLGLALFFLAGCGVSKSDVQGKWQTVNDSGQTISLTFKENTVSGPGIQEPLKVTGKGFHNSVKYLIVTIGGEDYTVAFLEKDKKTAALIKPDGDDPLVGNLVFFMSKTEKPDYDAYVKKYRTKLGLKSS